MLISPKYIANNTVACSSFSCNGTQKLYVRFRSNPNSFCTYYKFDCLHLSANRTISLRDVYYTLKALFKNQNESNSTVIELGRILGLLRRNNFNLFNSTRC